MSDFQLNPFFAPNAPYSDLEDLPVILDRAKLAREELSTWGVAQSTPLHEMRMFAQQCGIQNVFVKDEGRRAPLKSFKSLGGAYALGEALRDHIFEIANHRPSYEELFKGECEAYGFCGAAATDGNHGRSLAWGASLFGIPVKIYLPNVVSKDREDAIAQYGAEIVRIDANYDETFKRLQNDASANGWSLIQDISTKDYMLPHQRVMEGYTLMAEEIVQELDRNLPTHVFLQVGCGGMAAAIMAHFINSWPSDEMPIFVLIEATNAASTLASFRERKPVVVGGNHETIMVGIAVGTTSYLPWLLFKQSAHSALSMEDSFAEEAMRYCARNDTGDPSFVSGETGACGMGALLALQHLPDVRRALDLNSGSKVLVINSEGDTDPNAYNRIVNQTSLIGQTA
ncbi:MAG: diaminopropionate ammonia-lyase, partial [Pseudomonadota bacterium]